jgi:hypothetical protein
MRHVLLLGAPATGPPRMGKATAAARLVAPAGGALSVMSSLLRTAAGTVNLAAVAAAADEHLSLAADTHEQPGRRFHRLGPARAWTTSAMGGILPRHACSARCGARRRSGLGGLGRRRAWPADPAGRHRAIVRSTNAATLRSCVRRAPACGYVDNARALPTCPQGSSSQRYFDCFGTAGQTLLVTSQPASVRAGRDTSPSGCAIFARVLTTIHINISDRKWSARVNRLRQ